MLLFAILKNIAIYRILYQYNVSDASFVINLVTEKLMFTIKMFQYVKANDIKK